jgi:hypothetical protein
MSVETDVEKRPKVRRGRETLAERDLYFYLNYDLTTYGLGHIRRCYVEEQIRNTAKLS